MALDNNALLPFPNAFIIICPLVRKKCLCLFNDLYNILIPLFFCMVNCSLPFLVCNLVQTKCNSVIHIFVEKNPGSIRTPMECRLEMDKKVRKYNKIM